MDVTRGDRVLWYGAEYEVVDAPSRTGVVPLRTVANGHYVVAVVNSLSPVPPEVVTLTLSYRGHEVSEPMSVPDWRAWLLPWPDGVLARAARALAEKVDADD